MLTIGRTFREFRLNWLDAEDRALTGYERDHAKANVAMAFKVASYGVCLAGWGAVKLGAPSLGIPLLAAGALGAVISYAAEIGFAWSSYKKRKTAYLYRGHSHMHHAMGPLRLPTTGIIAPLFRAAILKA